MDVVQNVLEQDRGFSQVWFGSGEKQAAAVKLRLHSNTFVGGADRISYHADVVGEMFEAFSNLCWVTSPSADPRSMHAAAKKNWNVRGNYSIRKLSIALQVGLDNHVIPEMRFRSTSPLDRDYLRVDETLLKTEDPFPGALPPGPAPPEGDWFTELQDRFKETLQYTTPKAREFWSQPIELPTDDTDAAISSEPGLPPVAGSQTESTIPNDDNAPDEVETDFEVDDANPPNVGSRAKSR